jgi:hypothetical protein
LNRRSTIALSLLTGFVGLAPEGHAGDVSPFSGELLGEVRSAAGIVQMGASVTVYNRYDKLIRQTLTDANGRFAFDVLMPDIYSVKVILASFAPALQRNIAIAGGSQNVLRINLASMLSTVELVPASASKGTLMTDDWKWVLRTSQATRPVLRLVPVSSSSSGHTTTFTETTGVIRLSGGDGDPVSGSTAQDLGTSFALATVVNGSTHVRLSGNYGYMANSGLPTAGFRTTYSRDRDGESGPQMSLTVRQVYFPGIAGAANPNSYPAGDESGPALRTVSLGMIDKIDLSDQLRLEYGGHFDSVSFQERINYTSPFARATYDLGPNGSVRVAFSSGAPPQELIVPDGVHGGDSQGTDLSQDLNALAMLPRISSLDGRMRLQRTENLEVGYKLVRGSRKYSVAAYSEGVSDAAYSLSSSAHFLPAADLLPDLDSRNYLFDIGSYQRTGYTGSVTQSLGEHVDLTLAAGRGGALVAESHDALVDSAAGVRALIQQGQRSWATARASFIISGSGTRIITSYGWTDFRALMPVHMSLTGDTTQDEGWNIGIRQPLPRVGVMHMHGRLEATAEMRNALAQGYLPLNAGGQNAVLTNSPRVLRGGLSYLF